MTNETRPVALTAQFTAKACAIESQRVDALFHDPWADRFAGRVGDAWLASLGWDARITTPEEVGRRLARWSYPPQPATPDTRNLPNAFFVTVRQMQDGESP